MGRKSQHPSDLPSLVYVIDKPVGWSSFETVRRLGRCLGTRKVGHCGTLDPEATGVLVVCTGHATRLVQYLTADDKTYEGTLEFGAETTTDDREGDIRASVELTFPLDVDAILAASAALTGTQDQVPPAFSAIHVDGERAYELARRGEAPELAARSVHVGRFDVVPEPDSPTLHFAADVSKGTYIRSLVRDLGRATGLLAHMTSLRRTRSGSFDLDLALPDGWWELIGDELVGHGLNGFERLTQFPLLELQDDAAIRLRQGKTVDVSPELALGLLRGRMESTGQFIGLLRIDEPGVLKVERLLPHDSNPAST